MTDEVNPEHFANKTLVRRLRWRRIMPLVMIASLLTFGLFVAASISFNSYLEADAQADIRNGKKLGLTPADEWAMRFPKSSVDDQRQQALTQLIAFGIGILIVIVASVWLIRKRLAEQRDLADLIVEPLPDHICKNCGYDLRGSDSKVCSECGCSMARRHR